LRYQNGGTRNYIIYKCHRGRTTPNHGLGSVPETAVVAFSKEEATRLRMPGDRVALAIDDVAKREALNARLARAHRVYVDGGWTLAEYEAEKMAINVALDALVGLETVEMIHPINWSQPPEVVNATLRALWDRVELGPDLRPTRFVWLVPEWRTA
jgi:hypothetical protein